MSNTKENISAVSSSPTPPSRSEKHPIRHLGAALYPALVWASLGLAAAYSYARGHSNAPRVETVLEQTQLNDPSPLSDIEAPDSSFSRP